MQSLEKSLEQLLAKIPYAGKENLLEVDYIQKLEIDRKVVKITLRLEKKPEDSARIEQAVRESFMALPEVENVFFLYTKPKKTGLESDPGRIVPKKVSLLANFDKVILIGSGKGGVGKSTFSVNLALALKKLGRSVALFDADIYGPSLPMMMGLKSAKPTMTANKMNPLSRYGVEFISIGNLVEEKEAVAWRGPMVHQAVQQLLRDTNFSGGDYMLIDLPPGTGDVQISLAQLTEATGVVVVSTPQDVALIDARRAMAMFEKVNVPILGMVENMAYFSCPHCGKPIEIFGQGGAKKESEEQQIPFLGALPLDPDARIGADLGKPVVLEKPESVIAQAFFSIARELEKLVD